MTQDPFGLFQREVVANNDNTDFFPALNLVYAMSPDTNFRVSTSKTANRPEFRELAPFEFTDVVGNRAIRGNPDLTRALIQNYDGRWERISGGRNVLAASFFAKYFDDPIERVIIAAAQPIASFENAESARNLGLELELGQQLGRRLLRRRELQLHRLDDHALPEATRQVQTSAERPLPGPVQEPVQRPVRVRARRLLDPAPRELLRRPDRRRRLERGSGHHRRRPQHARPRVQPAARPPRPARELENLTDSDVAVHPGDGGPAALQAGAHLLLHPRLHRFLRRASATAAFQGQHRPRDRQSRRGHT